MHALLHLFGLDSGSGTPYLLWSGVIGDASILAAAAAWVVRAGRHHRERLAQAARHHRELLEQAAKHHAEIKAQAEKHHRQQLDALAAEAPKGM